MFTGCKGYLHTQDPNTLSVEEILGTYKHRHDNLHQELEDDELEVTVTDYVAHASLEKRRPGPEPAEDGDHQNHK